MANKITDTKYYASIADAIRAKNGSSDTYYPADMAQAIENIPSGGGGDTLADILLNKTATQYINSQVTGTIRDYMFNAASSLQVLKLPNITRCEDYSFANCTSLVDVDFSSLTYADTGAFGSSFADTAEITFPELLTVGSNCFMTARMKKINLPKLTTMGSNMFYQCPKLEVITLGSDIDTACGMNYCSSLQQIIFGGNVTTVAQAAFYNVSTCMLFDFSNCTAVPTLQNTNAFNRITSPAKIVVPDSLYEDWIAATNWSTYASYIIKKSDYDAL